MSAPLKVFRYRLTLPGSRLETLVVESVDDLEGMLLGGWLTLADGRMVNLDLVLIIEKLP
jgi:hypothetical protein